MSRYKAKNFKVNLIAVVAPILAILALTSWALASPVGASPDDDFHLTSTWCATNVDSDQCHLVDNDLQRSVPNSLLAAPCFAFKSEESAACQGDSFEDTNNFVTSDRGNFGGAYPPIYYLSMNLLAGDNIELSAVLMRVANVLIFVGMTGAAYALLPKSRRSTLVWGWAISLVPLGMFLIASNNPSSWAIISAGTVWISLLGYFEARGARKFGLGSLAAVATIMGAGARADAAAYAVAAVVVVVLLTARWERRWLLSTLLPFSLALAAAALYLMTAQSTLVSSGLHSATDGTAGPGLKSLVINNLLNVPGLWAGVFGTWGLGWLDTAMPAVVWVAALGAFGALAFAGLVSESIRKLLAILVLLVALWVVPTYILVKSEAFVGSEVQPRYILPLVIMLGGVALLHTAGPRLALSRGQVTALIAALSVANALALHFNMRRYLTGTDGLGVNLDTNREWWWDIPVQPMTVWAIGSISFAILLVLLARPLTRTRVRPRVRDLEPVGALPESNDDASKDSPTIPAAADRSTVHSLESRDA